MTDPFNDFDDTPNPQIPARELRAGDWFNVDHGWYTFEPDPRMPTDLTDIGFVACRLHNGDALILSADEPVYIDARRPTDG